jgi:predicted anti-sigma-YlaC factor YlaD
MLRVLKKNSIGCVEVGSLLCEYVDGELNTSLTDLIDNHVSSCEACRSLFESYQKTVFLARDLPEYKVTVEAQNRLRTSLNKKLGLKMPMVAKQTG